MGKLNIDQILISGTPAQKMLLLSEDEAKGVSLDWTGS